MPRVPRALIALVRIALGALLLYAAWGKLRDPHGAAADIANYRLLPGAVIPWIAVMLPGVELALGAALLLGIWVRAAAVVTAALLLVFTGALAQALLRGIDLACGCFGAGGALADGWSLARNGVLMLAAGLVAWRDRGMLG